MDKKLLLLLLRSRRSANQGLSLLEVLVATMVVFFTLMGALQGILYAAIFQVKAERQAQASFWIQQDLEEIKSQAASTTTPPSYASSCTGTTCCTSAFSTSYAGALQTSIGASTTQTKPLVNKTYTLTRTTSGSNTNPQVLTINYTVNNASDLSNLATLYTEIIPSAALSCP